MDIDKNYNRSVNIERLADEESGDKQEYILNQADVQCLIQSLDENYSEDIEGNFGKDFLMFCDISDIKEFDRAIDQDDGTEYRVVGVRSFALSGNPHMEIRIRTFNP
jgi:hypothetical protein